MTGILFLFFFGGVLTKVSHPYGCDDYYGYSITNTVIE